MSPLPQLHVTAVHKVFDDGNHNAFTDLCRFKGHFYLTFRSCPDGHGVFATSRIVVLVGDGPTSWEQVYEFNVPERDVRDPHFLVFHDRLFVYTGTWRVPPPDRPRDMNEHLGYAAWSDDGHAWAGPRMLEGTYGHYIWRAVERDGKAYLCARRRREFAPLRDGKADPALVEGALLESDDGLVWRFHALFTREYGDEAAFAFDDDGTMLALSRGIGGRPARVCRSQPPYTQWTQKWLDINVGGPLLARWGEHYLVGGRNMVDPTAPYTALYWLADDRLHQAAHLPSGGDNSYPGFVPLDERHGWLSYYSSHEGSGTSQAPSAIYLAEIHKDTI